MVSTLEFTEKQLSGGRNRTQGDGDIQGGGGQQDSGGGGGGGVSHLQQQDNTWVHEIFQAVVTRELKCLNCEAVSSESLVLALIRGGIVITDLSLLMYIYDLNISLIHF